AHLVESTAAMKTALQFVSHFMPKQLVRDLLATGKNIGTGGESRVITVMFTDLASFSSLAEKVTPAALTERVSDYLDVVSSEAIKLHGTIDKYIGDAVMALWNAPDLDPDHIAHACLAALNGVRALEVSNQRWAEKHWPPLRMRVGLHTDRVIVGVIGSSEFVSYTALGDGVNIASRLEGINKNYGTQICVSHTIYTAVSERFLMRPLDYVAVKGRKEPILIYELMGEHAAGAAHAVSAARRELAALTVEAFAAWAAKDPALALEKFRGLLARFPGDSVGEFYVKRCTEELSALSAPTEAAPAGD
ncbi:MAG TPA: adenylate/guanylate cyclase domain-containing protein, partial [Pseudomonadota bacterium]|nr:adenylate/guanylate cyclase domain-containing protein [Pseudomonadota bacterium]